MKFQSLFSPSKFVLSISIDCHIINFTRLAGGDNTKSISSTNNAVKLFM